MTRPSRGLSLGAVLLVITLLVTLAFSLASLSVSQLTMVSSLSSREEAENAAQAAISQAIERLQTDVAFGSSASNNTVHVTLDAGEGWLTFDPDRAAELDLPWSTNNLEGTGSAKGWEGRSVAPGCVRLLAQGTARGHTQRLEAVLRVPALPTLASGGDIDARGGVTIASVDSFEDIEPIVRHETKTEPRPADLLSNSASSAAVVLGAGTSVTGDVQAVGNIQLGAPADCRVAGEVHSGAVPVALPQVNLESMAPAGTGWVDLPATLAGQTVAGRARSLGPVTINGDLELDSAFLYIAGDLTVHGAVKGRGALVVLGNTTIENGASLNAGHKLALLSRGSVTLTGGGPQGSFFQGLVYTEGSLSATRLTVVGSVLARGADRVGLTESNVISLGQTDDFKLGRDKIEVNMLFPMGLGSRHLTLNIGGTPDDMVYRMHGEFSNGPDTGDSGSGDGHLQPGNPISVNDFWVAACQAWDVPTVNGTVAPTPPQRIQMYSPTQVLRQDTILYTSLEKQELANLLKEALSRAQTQPIFEYRPSKLWRWEDRIRVCLWRKGN